MVTTIQAKDVGERLLRRKPGAPIDLQSAIGYVQKQDIGKRVYRVGSIYQVESSEQRDGRIRGGV